MTNEMAKMTKKDFFNAIAIIVKEDKVTSEDTRQAYLNFIAHEIELLDRKAEKSKETKTQKENVGIMGAIKSALVDVGKAVTISELQAVNAEMAGYSNQKLSALLKKLVDAGEVVKTTDKKKSYFSAVNFAVDSVPTPIEEQDRKKN